MSYYFDPLDRACKSATGAVPRGTEVTFRIYERNESGEESFSALGCTLYLYTDGEEALSFPMKRVGDRFEVALRFPVTGLYFYHFELDGRLFGCGRLRRGSMSEHAESWQITVYDETYTTPEWMRGGIMYQVFPDRFAREGTEPIKPHKILRSDWGGMPEFRPAQNGKVLNIDFFGGNFRGVMSKLDYLQSLGVTLIYFNPIFEANSNHRYDTGDYMKIDRLLGTEEDFDELILEAKKRGIRVILDGVFNHTGDDSRYFNKYGRYKDELGAHQSPDSPYADWYHFTEYPDEYDCWWGIDILPAVNESSESYQNFICGENGVLKTWLRHGIAGYRLDVADELPDFFLQRLRDAVKSENEDAVIIGEVWEDASNKIAYDERRKYLQGLELDSVMNYPLKDGIISYVLSGSTLQLRETIAMLIDNYPKCTLDCLMNVLGTHDTPRILTVLGGRDCADKEEMAATRLGETQRAQAKEKLKMAALLQYTLPGVPCVYYGDESGMEGYRDPFCRRCFDWENIDGELLDFYRQLGQLRRGALFELFRDGEYREIYADRSCLVFARQKAGKSVFVFTNNDLGEHTVKFEGTYRELLTQKRYTGGFSMKGVSYGVLVKE